MQRSRQASMCSSGTKIDCRVKNKHLNSEPLRAKESSSVPSEEAKKFWLLISHKILSGKPV